MNHTKMRVAVIYGGVSGEHEISLLSAASVIANLNPLTMEVLPIGIDKLGRWWLNPLDEVLQDTTQGASAKCTNAEPINILQMPAGWCDVVFPVCHGPLYEDGVLQGVLQSANVAYVGADVLGSAIGMDKAVTKELAKAAGLPVVPYYLVHANRFHSQMAALLDDIVTRLTFPMFVKPNNLGSSVGISRVTTINELAPAIEVALRYDQRVLVEQGVSAREIELAVLQNSDDTGEPLVSIAGEIIYAERHAFYSYEAKYTDTDDLQLVLPAAISDALLARLKEAAKLAFTSLHCAGMARCDFFVDRHSEQFYFNELNTIPGFTKVSMYPKLWQASGLPYAELLTRLVELAQQNHAKQQALCRSH